VVNMCVLFLDVTPKVDGRVHGLLLRTSGGALARLDLREGNYIRTVVTDLVTTGTPIERPDVIWVYIGADLPRKYASEAIREHRGWIRSDYVSLVEEGITIQLGPAETQVTIDSIPAGTQIAELVRMPKTVPVDPQRRKLK
jgi:hypothetical protein